MIDKKSHFFCVQNVSTKSFLFIGDQMQCKRYLEVLNFYYGENKKIFVKPYKILDKKINSDTFEKSKLSLNNNTIKNIESGSISQKITKYLKNTNKDNDTKITSS